MTIGGRIKQWRAEKGLKQDEASSLLGIPYSTYQKYEINDKKPGAYALEAFANVGININWLLTGIGSMLLKENETVSISTATPQPLDMELLQFCIEAVESELVKNDMALEPKAKADVIRLMYLYCMLDANNKQSATVARVLKLVA
ncbi:helix-turn-helix domain-containing protein [Methylomonas koyamae]|uniref:Uncharacterized protein n=1 Tax=Methylomonas koyamae TaxID=702114 RepID=A0A291IG03_9GAMM|nr:helix-turn-helix transcriptional regulator [Methylomonas koyamae]ATG89100.1 transcriptional regulator [Methylomonas koyamae]OAI29798.1 hypothetical protein A1356_22860 [Methylomonas koyamae]